MPTHIDILGRHIAIDISPAADKALATRDGPLQVEMELYFSCLIRKKVRFYDSLQAGDASLMAELSPQLQIRFRPVMTRSCGNDYEGDEPPLTDFPIANPRAYVPHWLRIDFRDGEWQGAFGYTEQD